MKKFIFSAFFCFLTITFQSEALVKNERNKHPTNASDLEETFKKKINKRKVNKLISFFDHLIEKKLNEAFDSKKIFKKDF